MTVDVSESKVAANTLGLWGGWALATAAGMVLGSLPYVFILDNLSLVGDACKYRIVNGDQTLERIDRLKSHL